MNYEIQSRSNLPLESSLYHLYHLLNLMTRIMLYVFNSNTYFGHSCLMGPMITINEVPLVIIKLFMVEAPRPMFEQYLIYLSSSKFV